MLTAFYKIFYISMNINDHINFISVEKEVTYIRRRYHIEDYIAEKNIPGDAYGRILHFILMPVFSIHLPFFFCEIARFSGMIVLYYRLTETALSALVKFDDKITFLSKVLGHILLLTKLWSNFYYSS